MGGRGGKGVVVRHRGRGKKRQRQTGRDKREQRAVALDASEGVAEMET